MSHLTENFRLPDTNGLLDWAQGEAWEAMLNNARISNLMTERMRREFETFRNQQSQRSFTRENIFQLIETLLVSRKNIQDQCVQDVFDLFCRFDDKNRLYGNTGVGWKTNDAHRVNRKVIVPHLIEYSFNHFSVSYGRNYESLDDIDKALCTVAGKSFDAILTLRDSLSRAFAPRGFPSQRDSGTSEFFDWRAYKKGTLHLVFRDETVWERFNIVAAHQKGWLPAGDAPTGTVGHPRAGDSAVSGF